jgi:hypothetical protein
VGRDEELGRVLALLEAARGGVAGALVVSGEAGIGKTTLLQAAEELAGGFTCLWARGVESEAALGHAALLELLGPVRERLVDLAAAQAEALAAALGWRPAGPGSGTTPAPSPTPARRPSSASSLGMRPTPPWRWRCWPGSRPPAASTTTPVGP